MFVKGLEGSDENTAILQDAPHPEVDVLQHLTAFSHRLKTRDNTRCRGWGIISFTSKSCNTSFPVFITLIIDVYTTAPLMRLCVHTLKRHLNCIVFLKWYF